MLQIAGIIGLLALGATVLLIRGIGRKAVSRSGAVVAMAAVFAIASAVSVIILFGVQILHELTTGWTVAVVGIVVVLLGLSIAIARAVRWKPLPVLALLGVWVCAFVAVAVFAMTGISESLMVPVFQTTIQQMAEEAGFTALVPPGYDLDLDEGNPLSAIDEPGGGLEIRYEDLTLAERPAAGTLDDLEALVAPGGAPISGVRVPSGTDVEETSVLGHPAFGVTLDNTPWASAAKPGGESATVLVTIIDDVEVRLVSFGHPNTQPDGTSSTVEALTVGELAELAESLESLE